jgi:multidrug efflux pump subunit AcrA (membrane-fusion protein)
MFSRADIMIIELKDAIIVPTTTIITVAQDYTVVPIIPKDTIVKGDDESETGVVELQDVKTGYATSDYAQIIKGLQSGDTIVLESQGELKEKAKVKIIGKEEVSF